MTTSRIVLRESRGADGFDCTRRCVHAPRYSFGCHGSGFAKNANKKETTSTMKLVDVASMVLPYVCPLVHPSLPSLYHRIRAFLASIPRLSSISLSLLSHTKRTNFPSRFRRFPSSFSVLLSPFFSIASEYISHGSVFIRPNRRI